mgnify:CR=1 FL=1
MCEDYHKACDLGDCEMFNTKNRPNTRFGKSVPGATYTHDTICSGTSITLSSSSVSK